MLILGMQLWKSTNINPVSLWTFENSLIEDSVGSNTLTNVNGVIQNSAKAMAGIYAAEFNGASTQYLERIDANLLSGFPGKSGETNHTFTICGFFEIPAFGSTIYLLSKYNVTTDQRSYAITIQSEGTIGLNIGAADGLSYTSTAHATPLSINTPYFFAASYDAVTRNTILHLYDLNADEIVGVDSTETMTEDYYLGNTPFRLGARGDDASPLTGYLDNIQVFNKVLSSSLIDRVRIVS